MAVREDEGALRDSGAHEPTPPLGGKPFDPLEQADARVHHRGRGDEARAAEQDERKAKGVDRGEDDVGVGDRGAHREHLVERSAIGSGGRHRPPDSLPRKPVEA